MIIEPIEYASNFIKKLAARHAPNAKAYAMFQLKFHTNPHSGHLSVYI